VAGNDVVPELPRSVSPQLTFRACSPSVSPRRQQVTSPPAHSAQACADAGQHKLSRFGLAAARASTDKPLLGTGGKGAELAEGAVPEQGLTALVTTDGQSIKGGVSGQAELGCCDDSNCNSSDDGSSSSQDRAFEHHQVPAPAPAACIAVPDTPALETACGAAAFAAQHSLEQEALAVGADAPTAAAWIEQELQCAAAEQAAVAPAGPAAPAAEAGTCSAGPRQAGPDMPAPSSNSSSGTAGADRTLSSNGVGASSSRQAQHVSWSADSTCATDGGCEHHGPPASPCTPQQDAEQQQQQQQLQSPERQQGQQQTWTPAQSHADTAGSCDSPSKGCILPRSKAAAAYPAGNASAAAAAVRAASDSGTSTARASAAPGVWSPTHHVQGSGRHRSPSALLMRLSQKQVEVLMSRGRASNAVSYVLPHRSRYG
jgi:hypothetical protein